jgi:hypothetical protein
MAFIVVVDWPINTNQTINLYPSVLKDLKIRKKFVTPQIEFFAFDTEQEALDLKDRIEKQIPVQTYACVDDDNKPILDQNGQRKMIREPQITIGRD